MTVIDVSPGAGWWTDIIAPYLRPHRGRPLYRRGRRSGRSEDRRGRGRSGRRRLRGQVRVQPSKLYGDVKTVGFGPNSHALLATPRTVDLVLVSREIHDWAQVDGFTAKAFGVFRAALKPRGVLAIGDHRAPDERMTPSSPTASISEAWVIGEASRDGFALAARSDINANPKDNLATTPFGVSTLAGAHPPQRPARPAAQPRLRPREVRRHRRKRPHDVGGSARKA